MQDHKSCLHLLAFCGPIYKVGMLTMGFIICSHLPEEVSGSQAFKKRERDSAYLSVWWDTLSPTNLQLENLCG